MDFRELAYIVSITKHQGVGKAAEEMHVSQPTLSKFVQNLENSLGQPVFRKLGNKFLLTYAGERYVETAKTILKIKQDLDKELSDIIKDDIGELKIGFRRFGGYSALSRALLLFRKRYPRIKISVFEGHSSQVERMIVNGELDLAFIIIQSRHPDLDYEIIGHEEVILVMPRDHPKAKRGIPKPECRYPWMDMALLKDEPFILQWPDQRNRQVADKIFHDAGIKPNTVLTMKNIYAAIQLAIDGYGLAFASETTLHFTHTTAEPACFSVGNPYTTFELAAVYRQGMYMPAYSKYFIGIMKELIHENLSF